MDRNLGKRFFFAALVVFLFSGVLYSSSLTHDFFLWDDPKLILYNDFIRSPSNIPFLFTPAYWKYYKANLQAGKYRPIRSVSFAIDYALWGKRPIGYHLTNLLAHAANSMLVFGFTFFLLKKNDIFGKQTASRRRLFGAEGTAMVAALLFAAHPIHIESVVWVKNRSDLFALGFMLSAMWGFEWFATAKGFGRSAVFLSMGLFFFLMALCSKEMAITLPILLTFYIFIYMESQERAKAVWGNVAFFMIAAGFAFFYFHVLKLPPQNNHPMAGALMDSTPDLDMVRHISLIFITVFKYINLLLFPCNLSFVHEIRLSGSLFDPDVLGGAVVVVSIALLAVALRGKKAVLFSLIWVAITILPVSNLIYLDSRPFAEQRMYIPSVGFCVLLSLGIAEVIRNMESRLPLGIVEFIQALFFVMIVGAYSFRTVVRIDEWNRPLDFWRKTVENSPMSPGPWVSLGNYYCDGVDSNKKKLAYDRAIKLDPGYIPAYHRLADYYYRKNEKQKSIDVYRQAIEKKPFEPESYRRLADLFIEIDEVREAIFVLQKAFKIGLPDAELYFIAGHAYVKLRRYRQAERYFREALRINPYHALSYNYLGAALIATGEYRQAIDILKRAVRYQPDMGEAHNNLAFAYIEIGDRESAHVHLREAKRLGWKPNRALERRILE